MSMLSAPPLHELPAGLAARARIGRSHGTDRIVTADNSEWIVAALA
ncbi:MAG: hypothetical protein ACYCU7_18240 [Acidimicrobiales bacterium]